MASLGQDLKRERELRGISLKEISDSTRISLRLLQALEEDRLEVLPGRFFIRAILRSYAKTIGLDENQVLNKYDEMQIFEEQLQHKEAGNRPQPQSPRRALGKKRIALLSFALVMVALAATFLFVFVFSPEEKPRPSQKPQPQHLVPTVEVAPSSPPPQPAGQKIQGLRLEVLFTEETWLHVYADGASIWEGIKNRGESLTVEAAREVVLNVGNAGGPQVTINGRKARPLGPLGAVRTDIKITLENYREFLASAELEKN
ncbi:MAG: RodZ domain-containing protein [Acidobacteriota bacterium]